MEKPQLKNGFSHFSLFLLTWYYPYKFKPRVDEEVGWRSRYQTNFFFKYCLIVNFHESTNEKDNEGVFDGITKVRLSNKLKCKEAETI